MDKKKNERIFQAVMIADSLKNSFEIFERSCPTILMPCLNIPMLRYTVEFLISNSITELFIFAHSNQKEILEFINTVFDAVQSPLCLVPLWNWKNLGLWKNFK